MIVKELQLVGDEVFTVQYSNTNKYVVDEFGNKFAEAFDPMDAEKTYVESEADLYSAEEIADFQKHLAGLNK
jgi:hypothetical protein